MIVHSLNHGESEEKEKNDEFQKLQRQCSRVVHAGSQEGDPELGKTHAFWAGIAAACTGWVLMHVFTGKLTSGYWAYGLALMIAGCAASLLLYPSKDEN